jgi:hypothetical protein
MITTDLKNITNRISILHHPVTVRKTDQSTYTALVVAMEPHAYGEQKYYKAFVVKVTNNFILVKNNEVSTTKYRRTDGASPGTGRMHMTKTYINKEDVKAINEFVTKNGKNNQWVSQESGKK